MFCAFWWQGERGGGVQTQPDKCQGVTEGVANGLSKITNLGKFKLSLGILALKKASQNLGLARNRMVSESRILNLANSASFEHSRSFRSLRLRLIFLNQGLGKSWILPFATPNRVGLPSHPEGVHVVLLVATCYGSCID